jgi:hypothetical protein
MKMIFFVMALAFAAVGGITTTLAVHPQHVAACTGYTC